VGGKEGGGGGGGGGSSYLVGGRKASRPNEGRDRVGEGLLLCGIRSLGAVRGGGEEGGGCL